MREFCSSLLVLASLAFSASAFAQTPLKPSQVRPNVPGPAAKRSPGPMIDPANAKGGPEGEPAKKPGVPPHAALPTKKAAAPSKAPTTPPEDEAEAVADPNDPRLEEARKRIGARTPAAAAEIRKRRADMVAKALQATELPLEVKAALEHHVKRLAELDRIETIAVERARPDIVDRVVAARREESVRISLWLMKFGEGQRGGAK